MKYVNIKQLGEVEKMKDELRKVTVGNIVLQWMEKIFLES